MKKYEEMTSKELKQLGKEKKVKNWWTLNKAQLVEALLALEPKEEKKEEKTQKSRKSNLKVIYAEKDNKIHVIKDNGTIWGLWYKYNAQGFKNIMAFEYDKCFGDKVDTNKKTIKKSSFIRANANPDITITDEEFEKIKEVNNNE